MSVLRHIKHRLVVSKELILIVDLIRSVVGMTPLERAKWVPDFWKENP
jgi:hypothetical protein